MTTARTTACEQRRLTSHTFRLPVEPKPTPRPRTRVIAMKGRAPIATIYSPKDYQEWQKEMLAALQTAAPVWFDGAVAVTVECFGTRPKTSKLAAPRGDADNYGKGVLDAITKDGRFWSDDAQVLDLTIRKRWAPLGEPGHIIVTLEPCAV